MNAMRQDAQKPVRKFCRSKEGKNSETHPEKPEKGETGCVPGAGEGCSRYGRVGKPEIRTKMHQIAMQHMKKENRRKPSVFAGFFGRGRRTWSPLRSGRLVACVPPARTRPSARGFGVDVGEHIGEREKADVTRFPPQSHKRPVLVWCCEVFWQAKAAVKLLLLEGPPPRGRTRTTRRGPGRCRRLGRGFRPNPRRLCR